MKPATLMLSTALASMMLLAPISFSHADAAGIKIKPQIVKVRPKIAVAKPKVRVKIRAAKVRIKPKIKTKTVRIKPKIKVKAARIKPRIKIKKTQPKLIARTTATPKFKITPRVKPQLQPRVVGKLTVKQPHATSGRPDWWRPNRWKPQATVKLILPDNPSARHPVQRVATPTMNTGNTSTLRPSRKMSNTAAGNIQTGSMKQAGRSFDQLANHNGIKDASNAARAAEAARDVVTLGKLRVASTPELGLPTPDTGRTMPGNQDILNGMNKQPGETGASSMNSHNLWGQKEAGVFGPDSFSGLPNTHSQGPANSRGNAAGDAAKGFWGVTPERIEASKGGVASGADSDRPHDERRIDSYGGGTRHIVHEDRDGNKHEQWYTVNGGHEGSQYSEERRADGTVAVYRETRRDGVTTYEGTDTRTGDSNRGTTELRDPDSGYSGPNPFPWIEESEKADLSTAGNGKTPGGLPAAPEQGQPTGRSSGSAMYSASDVLERYDENSRRREERFKRPGNLCFHSECKR